MPAFAKVGTTDVYLKHNLVKRIKLGALRREQKIASYLLGVLRRQHEIGLPPVAMPVRESESGRSGQPVG